MRDGDAFRAWLRELDSDALADAQNYAEQQAGRESFVRDLYRTMARVLGDVVDMKADLEAPPKLPAATITVGVAAEP